MDATLRLFAPDADPEKIRAKKPYRRTKLFGAGKLNRLILGALRRGEQPMTTAEVVDLIVADLGYGEEPRPGCGTACGRTCSTSAACGQRRKDGRAGGCDVGARVRGWIQRIK